MIGLRKVPLIHNYSPVLNLTNLVLDAQNKKISSPIIFEAVLQVKLIIPWSNFEIEKSVTMIVSKL